MICQRKTDKLSAVQCLLYPNVFLGCVTVLAYFSCAFQKMAACYGNVCHGFLAAVTMHVECWRLQNEFQVTSESVEAT